LVEGDAGDGPGGITAHAGQGQEVLESFGKTAGAAVDDVAGGGLGVANAPVIAQSLPQFKDSRQRGAGEGFHRGQRAHPSFKIRDDGLDLRLLEHDFRNPDRVGVPGAAPGKVAGVPGEPGGQFGRDAAHVAVGHLNWSAAFEQAERNCKGLARGTRRMTQKEESGVSSILSVFCGQKLCPFVFIHGRPSRRIGSRWSPLQMT
jgi:hypothetical protein